MKIKGNSPIKKKVSGIKSGRVKVWLGDSENNLGVNVEELPPYTKFPDSNKQSYKFLGTTLTTRGETIEKYTVRKRKKHKDKHFTLKCSMSTKTRDIESIEDIENEENYKIVTTYLRLPKTAVRNLRDEFNVFLNPKPISISNPNKGNDITEKILNIIDTEKYAFGIIRMLFEKDEIYADDVMKKFSIVKASAIKYLDKMEQLDIIMSDTIRHNKKIYILKVNKDELKKTIHQVFE